MIMILMANWYDDLIYVKGAFIIVNFYNNEMIHLEVPVGF